MRRNLLLFLIMAVLSGCAQSLALIGPASSTLTSTNVIQSSVSSAFSYKVKKETGKSPTQHAIAYAKRHNLDSKKLECISFLESYNVELCETIKRNLIETQKKLVKKSKIKILN